MTISDKVIEVLKSVSGTDEVQKNLGLRLYDLQIGLRQILRDIGRPQGHSESQRYYDA